MMQILLKHNDETICYAASELKKYVTTLSRGSVVPCVLKGVNAEGIELKLLNEDGYDPVVDDVIDICIEKGNGYIAGSNPRSVLMGVYRFCASAGCQFIRPGENGDYVPHMDILNHSFKYRKKADYPFRSMAIEGAVSYEHVRDTIYWLPKIGMNAYMIEGVVPYTYMHKWYGHVGNTHLRQKGQKTDYDMLLEYVSMMEKDIKKVGLQLHSLGHDWMFEKIGEGRGKNKRFSEEDKQLFAQVNGVRDIMKGGRD